MSFNTALTSGNYDTLRGASGIQPSYYSWVYLSLCPNTVKFAAQINQASFASSFAQLTFDNVSVGAYTSIKVGMTLIIAATNDITKGVFTGRIRADNSGVVSTATTVNINETSADLADNYYIFVIDEYRIWDKLGRQIGSTQYKDYALTFRQLRPIIYNLESAYANWISGGVLTKSFAPLAVAATSGASISSWLWDVDDGTITVGSSTTQNITVTFPYGHRWVKLTVTDSGGRATTFKFSVHAHDPVNYPPQLLTAEQFQVTKDAGRGVDATVTAFAGVSGVLDNTLVVAWNEEKYQNGTAALTGDNIAFIGRFRQSADTGKMDEQYSLVTEAQYTIEGTLTQMARIEQLPYEFLNTTGTPTVWDTIKNLTLWRAIAYLLSEHTTVLELHSLSFDSTADTYLVDGLRTQVGNILSAVNDLAISINGAMQANAAGLLEVVRDAVMLSTSARNALVTVANWTDSDLLDVTLQHADVRTIGRLKATGGAYNSAADNFDVFESLAPGVAQDYPEGSADLERQVLTANAVKADAQTEINTRAGDALAKAQDIDTLTVRHPDGYHWLIPARNQWYTFTLNGTETTRGIVLTTDTRWLLTSVTVAHDSTQGSKDVQCTYVRETVGTPGQTVIYPPVVDSPLTIPQFPPFPPFPAFQFDPSLFLGTITPQIPVFVGSPNPNQTSIPANGNAVVIATATQCWATQTFISKGATPQWVEITPTLAVDETIVSVAFSGIGTQMYLLTNTTAHSYLYVTSNPFSLLTPLVPGSAIGGLFKLIRPTSTLNKVFIYNPNTNTGTTTTISDDMTSGLGAQTHEFSATYPFGIYNNTTGAATRDGVNGGIWVSSGGRTGGGCIQGAQPDGANISQAGCLIDLGATQTVSAASFWSSFAANVGSFAQYITFWDAAKVSITEWVDPVGAGTTGWYQSVYSGSPVAGVRYISFNNTGNSSTHTAYVDDILVTYGINADKATVGYSADAGLTLAEIEVGSSSGAFVGMDTLRIGVYSLAAKAGQTTKADTLGGAYASYGSAIPASGEPSALLIPRYKFGGTTNNNIAAPDYLIASSVVDGSNHAVWKATASGATFTNITDVISTHPGTAISGDCLWIPWYSSAKIAAILDFNGTRHLITSSNGGTAWSDRGALSSAADVPRMRKGDQTMQQLFFLDGTVGVKYSPDFGATILAKQYPSTDPLVALGVYG